MSLASASVFPFLLFQGCSTYLPLHRELPRHVAAKGNGRLSWFMILWGRIAVWAPPDSSASLGVVWGGSAVPPCWPGCSGPPRMASSTAWEGGQAGCMAGLDGIPPPRPPCSVSGKGSD